MHQNTKITRRVWLLGALRLEQNGQEIQIPRGKAQTLFAYLVLHPYTPHPREVIADKLWPNAETDRILRNFSDLLYRLRQSFNSAWFQITETEIALLADEALWVDVWAFEQLAQSHIPSDWQRGVNLYLGDLLPTLYDDWILPRRVSLQESFLACLERLGKAAEQARQFEAALSHYQRLIQANPVHEGAYRGAMRSLAGRNRFAEALNLYASLQNHLQNQLDIIPTPQTTALAQQLQSELSLAQQTSPATSNNSFLKPAFVGRIAERKTLLSRLDSARQGTGGMMILLGEGGSGKTRLLEEVENAAAWRGWQISYSKADDRTDPPPFSPLSQALNALLPEPRYQQLSQLINPYWLNTLSQLGLIAHTSPATDNTNPNPALLPRAITRLFNGLQQIKPTLIMLDDLQWADPALWPLLNALEPTLKNLRLLLLIAARPTPLVSQAPWETLQAWSAKGVPVIKLANFQTNELAQLVEACGLNALSPANMKQLQQASGGNPFLALTFLQTEADTSASENPTANRLVAHRLSHCSPPALIALQGASAIGYQFGYNLWESIVAQANIPANQLPFIAAELEQAGLLVLEVSGYRFSHDLVRTAVYDELSDLARQSWHKRILAILKNQLPNDPLSLLYHARQVNSGADIARYAHQTAQQDLARQNFSAARHHFSLALAHLPADDVLSQYQLLRGRVDALEVLADREAQQADLARLSALAQQENNLHWQVEVAQREAKFYRQTGQLEQAIAGANRGLAQAHNLSHISHLVAPLLELLGQTARDQGKYTEAQAHFEQALYHYQQLNNLMGQATVVRSMGIIAQLSGDFAGAVGLHQKALALAQSTGDLYFQMRTLSSEAISHWGMGAYEKAADSFKRTLSASLELGDKRLQASSLGNLGSLAAIRGDFETAQAYLQQSLAIEEETANTQSICAILGNLAEVERNLGQFEQALSHYNQALALNQSINRKRGEAYAYDGRGLTHLLQGRFNLAHSDLEQGLALRLALGEQDTIALSHANLALLYLQQGNLAEAKNHLQAGLSQLNPSRHSAEVRQKVHFVAYQIYFRQKDDEEAERHLQLAETAMYEICRNFSEADRDQFLRAIPLNVELSQAVERYNRYLELSLVKVSVSLGRKLKQEDYTTVRWTIETLADRRIDNKTKRRRHALARLINEAETQNAAPTHANLAQALKASRRTILRDIEHLAQNGIALPTRGRK